jgi:membrane protease YdiL (CAAX protease family)
MRPTPPEVAVAFFLFTFLWIGAVGAVEVLARRSSRVRALRDKLRVQAKPALAIAGLYLVAGAIGSGSGLDRLVGLTIGAVAIFCQALIGLAIARDIPGYEPLPVSEAIRRRDHAWSRIAITLLIVLLAVPIAFVVGSVGLGVGMELFGESNLSSAAASDFPGNKWAAFFLLLAGAGIAEETVYRLVALSGIWRLSGRRWLAILLSALLFAAYHLTPLSGMYAVFWQFPVSQFLASALVGIIWGFVYVRRGYEAAVLAHTLSDWVPLMLFAR